MEMHYLVAIAQKVVYGYLLSLIMMEIVVEQILAVVLHGYMMESVQEKDLLYARE